MYCFFLDRRAPNSQLGEDSEKIQETNYASRAIRRFEGIQFTSQAGIFSTEHHSLLVEHR